MPGYKDYKVRLFQTNETEDKSKELEVMLRDRIKTKDINLNKVELIEDENE